MNLNCPAIDFVAYQFIVDKGRSERLKDMSIKVLICSGVLMYKVPDFFI